MLNNVKSSVADLFLEVVSHASGRRVKVWAQRRCLLAGWLAILLVFPGVMGQERSGDGGRQQFAPLITATASAQRVRFTAPGTGVRMQLEIYSEAGETLFGVSSRGSVLDWTLADSTGQHVADGSYLCVVTVKSLNGKIGQRLGTVSVNGTQVSLRGAQAAQLSAAQQQSVGPVEEDAALTVLPEGEAPSTTVVAHDVTIQAGLTLAATTRVKSIHGAAFVPDNLKVGFAGFLVPLAFYSERGLAAFGDFSDFFIAPVELPDGAVITEFCIDAIDNRGDADISAVLGRTSLTNSAVFNLGHTFTGGASRSVQRPCVGLLQTVFNNDNVYWIKLGIQHSGSDGRLIGARITYQVTQPLP